VVSKLIYDQESRLAHPRLLLEAGGRLAQPESACASGVGVAPIIANTCGAVRWPKALLAGSTRTIALPVWRT
jgi:hypothetical protein